MKSDAQWDMETFAESASALDACEGLTPNQVKAIPRLLKWFKQENPFLMLDEYYDLRVIFWNRAK